MIDRQKFIDAIIENNLEYIKYYEGGTDWFYVIMYGGFVGYDSMTDEDLIEICLKREIRVVV